MAAAQAFVGCAERGSDLADHVDVLGSYQGPARACAEHAGRSLMVVGQGHDHACGGEGGHSQEAASFDVGAAQVGGCDDGIGVVRKGRLGVAQANLGQGDGATGLRERASAR